MIARYSRAEMAKVWEDRHRYQVWLKVELAVCEELAKSGRIPRKDWLELKKRCESLLERGGLDPERVEHHEASVRHDVIAFTAAVAETVGPAARYIHFGLTSSDVVDTSLSLLILEAGSILLHDIDRLLALLWKRAGEFRNLPTIGRSHGIFAEPTSFGLKFLGWYCEWQRNRDRLAAAIGRIRVGKLSGAVGVSPHWDTGFERRVLARLGLEREDVSTQVVPRDRHAEFLSVLAICGSSLERIAVEFRHLQRSEVGEVIENFGSGQKGSSAMPHKRNPISSENITGCARLLRGYAQAAFENIALWHERDISHSSVERVAFPDATQLLDYALNRMIGVIDKAAIRPETVRKNLEAAGTLVFSGHFLLRLVEQGASREDAYAWVQSCAIASIEGKGNFLDLLASHPGIREHLSEREIRNLGSLKYQLRQVPEIFSKVRAKYQRRAKKR